MKILKVVPTVVCLSAITSVYAQGMVGPPVIPTSEPPPTVVCQLDINQRLENALLPAKGVDHTREAVIKLLIEGKGRVNPQSIAFKQSSGSSISDFSCFDAIMSAAPFNLAAGAVDWKGNYSFYRESGAENGSNVIPSTSKQITTEYFKDHPALINKVALIRSIPESVLFKYPKEFKAEDLNSSKNIKAINLKFIEGKTPPKSYTGYGPLIKNNKIVSRYMDWIQFELDHPAATKTEILAEEKLLNKRYSELFQ